MKKTILITGTSTGFGKLMALQLAEQGHQVIASMRGINGKNAEVAAELASNDHITVKEIDVTKQETINKAVQESIEQFGKIDVLVNNAGVYGGGLQEAYSMEQVHWLFDVNVYGPLRMNQAVLPHMRERKDGLVINISSLIGLSAMPMASIYCATKFALEGLVEGSYPELLPIGVENVLVEPGLFPTEILQKQGVNADLPEVVASYGGLSEQMGAQIGQNMMALIEQKQPNPQSIADKVVELIHMEKGTRPMRNIVCTLCGPELCRSFETRRTEDAQKMGAAYTAEVAVN